MMRPKGSMRVAGGTAKGHRLLGTLSSQARPTTERVRAAIFNVLHPEVYRDRRVLDLYAGSGSLGIEALSLGAAWGDFVEKNNRQCEVIRANLKHTGFDQQAGVFCGEVKRSLHALPGAYSLVLLDPPYRMRNLDEVLDLIAVAPGLVEDGGMVVVGHSQHLDLPDTFGRLRRESHRRYGDNAVDFYRAGEPSW